MNNNLNRKSSWDCFLIEGDNLFKYMEENYQHMFDGDIIKHFNIIPGIYTSYNNINIIKEKYDIDIQKKLIHWIKTEFKNGNLLKKEDWKPFRDQSMLTCIYLGYKKLFEYRNYYFQLSIEPECLDCIYCDNKENSIHFQLVYYGFKENINDLTLKPYDYIEVLSGNILSEKFWNIK